MYEVENADLAAANQALRSLVGRTSSSPDDLLERCKKQRVERIALTDKAIVETVGSTCMSMRSIAHIFTDGLDPGYRQR